MPRTPTSTSFWLPLCLVAGGLALSCEGVVGGVPSGPGARPADPDASVEAPDAAVDLPFDAGASDAAVEIGVDAGTADSGVSGGVDAGVTVGLDAGSVSPDAGCAPRTCAAANKNCGDIDNGCGATITCGSCMAGTTCGGGGVANVCGAPACTPRTCASAGRNCGSIDDGCGAMLDCGRCVGFTTCGGGGTANVCGAADCLVTCQAGFTCNQRGVCQGGSLSPVVVNVPSVDISGEVKSNGSTPVLVYQQFCAEPINSSRTLLYVSFYNEKSTDTFSFEVTCSSAYRFSGRIPPGQYRVSVSAISDQLSESMPMESVVVQPSLTISGPTSGLSFNVVSHSVSGTITVDGAAPNCHSNWPAGVLRFTNRASNKTSQSIAPCDNSQAPFRTRLAPGVYDVRLGRSTANWSISDVLVGQALSVTGPVSTTFNLQTFAVSGSIRINGATPSLPAACQGASAATATIAGQSFIEKTKGHQVSISLLCSSNFNFTANLPAGTYEVPGLGGNTPTLLTVSGPRTNITIDLPQTFDVAGSVQLDAVPNDGSRGFASINCALPENASFFLGYVSFLETTSKQTTKAALYCRSNGRFTAKLPAGTYEVRAEPLQFGDLRTPVNLFTPVLLNSSLTVTGAMSNLALRPIGVRVSGTLRLNGNPVSVMNTQLCATNASQRPVAAVEFIDREKGNGARGYIVCNSPGLAFDVLLPPGNYEVAAIQTAYSDAIGLKLPRILLDNKVLVASAPIAGLTFSLTTTPVTVRVLSQGQAPRYLSPTDCINYVMAVSFVDPVRRYNFRWLLTCADNFEPRGELPKGDYLVWVQTAVADLNMPTSSYTAMRLGVP